MLGFIKLSTAYTFRLGPFLDDTDGKTAETSLTIAYTDCYLSKAGAAFAAKGETTNLTGTGTSQGYYTCVLNTTDTGTLGPLRVHVHVSGALPVWADFHVLPAMVYDSLFAAAATDYLQVDVYQANGNQVAAGAIPNVAAGSSGGLPTVDASNAVKVQSGTGANQISLSSGLVTLAAVTHTGAVIPTTTAVTNAVVLPTGTGAGQISLSSGGVLLQGTTHTSAVIPTVTTTGTATNVTTVNGLAANVITAASINTGAITNAKFAAGAIDAAAIADNAIDLATFAADCKTGSALKANVETVTASAIKNASFDDDVNTTAYATNKLALMVFKCLDNAITDATSLTGGGVLDRLRIIGWILRNKMTVADSSGDTTIFKDDSTTSAFTVSAALTDNSTTTTRLRMA
jgi:hypothetical protein